MVGNPPLFSIIVPHYQDAIPHAIFCRGIACLLSQTFKDFEILAYHDGPLLDPLLPMPISMTCTEKRYNDFGHSLRDRGIREARGQYLLFFNPDNILYPDALLEIANEIRRPARLLDEHHNPLDTNDIIIFPIRMYGLVKFRDLILQGPSDSSDTFYLILTGNPPVYRNIDGMQLVMKRELWLREGGWYDKSHDSDGMMFEAFTRKYGYRHVGPVLGEHH
jgi:hypothetical protein